jgi:phospholipase/carboxylesterase
MTALDVHQHRWEPATTPDGMTLLLLHGTGGDESNLLPLGRMIAPGAALLSPRGNVLEHGAPRFFRRLAEGVFDLDDLRARTEALARFAEGAAERYGFWTSQMYAVGFSNGANIAASLLLSSPRALAGAVLLRAMTPFEPVERLDLSATSVLLSQGRQDPIVSASTAERLAALLRDRGANVELVWQSASHSLVQADVTAATRWLAVRRAPRR